MNSYNLVNGVHATQNDFLNLKVLKGEWGFQGILMSDWDATYDGVAACNNGLDLEMPSPKFMNAKNLVPAVESGKVKESTIDDHVLRLIRTELRYGFTTRPQFDPADSTYSVADRPLALREALESITLLKNEGKLLPLDPAKIKTIAIIGPNAYPAVTGGGGSSQAHAFEPVSISYRHRQLARSRGACFLQRRNAGCARRKESRSASRRGHCGRGLQRIHRRRRPRPHLHAACRARTR